MIDGRRAKGSRQNGDGRRACVSDWTSLSYLTSAPRRISEPDRREHRPNPGPARAASGQNPAEGIPDPRPELWGGDTPTSRAIDAVGTSSPAPPAPAPERPALSPRLRGAGPLSARPALDTHIRVGGIGSIGSSGEADGLYEQRGQTSSMSIQQRPEGVVKRRAPRGHCRPTFARG